MSSADRSPGPPEPPPPWLHPVAYLLAGLLPIVLVLTVAAPLGAAWVWVRHAPSSVTTTPPPGTGAADGSRGLGDPYYPDAGNGGYDVHRYQILVSWDPATGRLDGSTTIDATATQALHSFYLDLALDISTITVNGQVAGLAKEGFSDWRITPAVPIGAGSGFVVVVDYAGRPGRVSHDGVSPWLTTGEEWTVAGEPESAAWWFPSNDHPSDPALMDTSIRVPHGLQAISTGRLVSADSGNEAGWDTWHWASEQPMATYLTFVSIGRFALERGTADGRAYVYAVSEQLSADDRRAAFAALETSAAKIRVLSTMFGPYPFSELGGIVIAAKTGGWAGLETQTRPVYAAEEIVDREFAPELVTHELAHMWFGDNVTVAQWNDIFDNEAYASWAFWAWQERTGGPTAQRQLRDLYDAYRNRTSFWRAPLIDPGRDEMFDSVYARGPIALQALRNVMGEAAFTRLNTDWAQEPGSRSLEQWMTTAQTLTTVDLRPFFRAWIYGTTAPAPTAQNGLG